MTLTPARLADPAEAVLVARELAPRLAARAARYDAAGEFPGEDFADLRAAGLLGLMELASGAGATALVFNMHASVTGAMAQTPDDVVRALGVPDSYFEVRDRLLSDAVGGALFAVAMSDESVK